MTMTAASPPNQPQPPAIPGPGLPMKGYLHWSSSTIPGVRGIQTWLEPPPLPPECHFNLAFVLQISLSFSILKDIYKAFLTNGIYKIGLKWAHSVKIGTWQVPVDEVLTTYGQLNSYFSRSGVHKTQEEEISFKT